MCGHTSPGADHGTRAGLGETTRQLVDFALEGGDLRSVVPRLLGERLGERLGLDVDVGGRLRLRPPAGREQLELLVGLASLDGRQQLVTREVELECDREILVELGVDVEGGSIAELGEPGPVT